MFSARRLHVVEIVWIRYQCLRREETNFQTAHDMTYNSREKLVQSRRVCFCQMVL